MAKTGKDLNDLFLETVKDIYFAEKQILRSLPKLAKAAQDPQLKAAFEKHREQTEAQVERLDRVFELINKPPRGKTCDAILGMIEEGKEVIEDFTESEALDAGLIAGAQAIEHYEISRYGTLISWAKQLGLDEAAQLLQETLQEEKQTDELLTKLASSRMNKRAA
jgi:ferritin-like metal-binding protein YciE